MELQTVTCRYKRGPRQECICHDDVYAVRSLENDLMKILGRVKVGQPGAVERGTRQMKPVTLRKAEAISEQHRQMPPRLSRTSSSISSLPRPAGTRST